jgi:hypothetical protein
MTARANILPRYGLGASEHLRTSTENAQLEYRDETTSLLERSDVGCGSQRDGTDCDGASVAAHGHTTVPTLQNSGDRSGTVANKKLGRRDRQPIFAIFDFATISRAGDRTRTGDVQLGKLAFYQLNYARTFVEI